MILYANPNRAGLNKVSNLNDGYTINLQWYQAYSNTLNYKIAYHIYYSTNENRVFTDGVKFVSIDNKLEANIIDLTAGQLYYFSVRAVEYDPNIITWLSDLPIAHDNLRIYPSSLLRSNISATDLVIPLLDTETFLDSGLIKIGGELIQFLGNDRTNNNLIVPASTDGIGAHLIKQSNSQFYIANPDNTGSGTINSLTLTSSSAKNETWKILCIFVETDTMGHPIAGTAKFEAIGSLSGSVVDGYGNYFIWDCISDPINNGILSFSITETSTFKLGDYFTIQTGGAILGLSGGRGYNNSQIRSHTVDGYDGYNYLNPNVEMFAINETNQWDQIYLGQCHFDYPNFSFNLVDGYKQNLVDILSTDLTEADASNVGFPEYDYSGWNRIDPDLLINGTCVGSYMGGQRGCIDGYGNFNILRGISLEDRNTQLQDVMLSMTGRVATLIRRIQTGIICSCVNASSEYPDDRCNYCFGTKYVLGFQQYFNPRQSDGRIMVRPSPTVENLKMYEAGLESEFPLELWTLTVPTIKTRDIIVLYDQDNETESYRYEVMGVTRNNTVLGLDGGQKFSVTRIRKTDIAYQIRVFADTSDFPTTMATTIGFSPGLAPHTHNVQTNEHDPSTWSQLTTVAQGHNHEVLIIDGVPVVQEILGHTHSIII